MQSAARVVLAVILASTFASDARGAGSEFPHMQLGSGQPTSFGDVVSSAGGLDSAYRYFIEVPPGAPQLIVGIYDLDLGEGLDSDPLDFVGPDPDMSTTPQFDTTVIYRLFDPTGTLRGFQSCNVLDADGCDAFNAELAGWLFTSPMAGLWLLEVDTSSAALQFTDFQNDANGYLLVINDGDASSSGVELNVFADSYIPLVGPPGSSFTYQLFPYVVSGGEFDANTFGFGGNGSQTFTSPTTTYSGSGGVSGAGWLNSVVSGWYTPVDVIDQGPWTWDLTIGAAAGTLNFGTAMVSDAFAAFPPTSQPQSNDVRLYLPADGGGPPAKPIVTKTVRHSSGPNPPQVGSTSMLDVSIFVDNPAAQPIVFGGANQLTATVPGGAVLFDSLQEVSAGSATAPAPGAGGTVSWNPGSIAAGTFQLIRYRMAVTPTGAATLFVTGTPGGSGTGGQYVDEVAQVFPFGPMQGVGFQPGVTLIPTRATIAQVAAWDDGGGARVRWTTASEVGTAAFRVERLGAGDDYAPVHTGWIVAPPNRPGGGVYEIADATVRAGDDASYRIVEVEARGRKRVYGPYRVTVEDAPPALPDGALSAPIGSTLRPATGVTSTPVLRAKLGVDREGLHRVTATQVAGALGMTETEARWRIDGGRLALSRGRRHVTYLAEDGGASLLFWAQAPERVFADYDVYWIERGAGLPMARLDATPAGSADAGATFADVAHAEQDEIPVIVAFDDPRDDFWMWDRVIAGDADDGTRAFSFGLDGLDGGDGAAVTVELLGATDTDHHVLVSVNGEPAGEASWNGVAPHVATFPIGAGAGLAEAGNSLEIEAVLDAGVPYSIVYLDAFDVSYRRGYTATDSAAIVRGAGAETVDVSGFGSDDLLILEIGSHRTRAMTGVAIEPASGGYAARFAPRTPDARYAVVESSPAAAPVWIAPDRPSDLLRADTRANYVVITPRSLRAGAETLAATRAAAGLTALVVDVEDIYDELAYGAPDPRAIRAFLARASRTWAVPPRYVALVGDGSYDYRDALGAGNPLPPMLIGTAEGLIESDSAYGDVEGNDGVPEIAVGRIPARTPAELAAYIGKLRAHEAGAADAWSRDALLVADDADASGDFAADTAALAAALVAGYDVGAIDLDSIDIATARQQVAAELAAGTGLVMYVGHAGLDRIAEEGVITTADVPGLGNAGRPPIVAASTCLLGRFGFPGLTTLGEALLVDADGGAAAVWAPAHQSDPAQARIVALAFADAIASDPRPILGDAVRDALTAASTAGVPLRSLRGYALLGDPALGVDGTNLPADPASPPTTVGETLSVPPGFTGLRWAEPPTMGTSIAMLGNEPGPDREPEDTDPDPIDPDESGGCGCEAGGAAGGDIGAMLLVLLGIAGATRGRRKRKPYVKPRVVYRERMELMAVACTGGTAKGSPGTCPTGPISS
jgi:MYXO-CTERM domain-containing protein